MCCLHSCGLCLLYCTSGVAGLYQWLISRLECEVSLRQELSCVREGTPVNSGYLIEEVGALSRGIISSFLSLILEEETGGRGCEEAEA